MPNQPTPTDDDARSIERFRVLEIRQLVAQNWGIGPTDASLLLSIIDRLACGEYA